MTYLLNINSVSSFKYLILRKYVAMKHGILVQKYVAMIHGFRVV